MSMASSSPLDFLTSVFAQCTAVTTPQWRPHVTLTFAQSLDAKIAGRDGKQLILSGKESMIMTHWMRTMHDAILVGVGTALNDDPQLNTRHLPPRAPPADQIEHSNPYHLPRPVILDSQLRLSPTCKLFKNYQTGIGRRPWVFCGESPPDSGLGQTEWQLRFGALESAGARIFRVPAANGHLSISSVLQALRALQVNTLMVEGGARVIASFLAENAARGIIDSIIVTVAPTLVGGEGVGYRVDLEQDSITGFEHVDTQVMGKDVVIAMRPVNATFSA